jgi:DNA end-binding protein Ku
VYALLRETLLKSGRAGVARVVIQAKQHLTALVPSGPALSLNLLRWGDAIRTWDDLNLPSPGTKGVGLKERELDMAEQLVDELTTDWHPEQFRDSFADDVMALVHKKIEAGQTERVIQPDAEEPKTTRASNVVDLTELLQRSLRGGSKKVGGQTAKRSSDAAASSAKAKPHSKRRAA